MIDQVTDDLTRHLFEIVIYSVGIGMTVKVLSFLLRHCCNIEIDRREFIAVSAGTSAFVTVFLIDRGPHVVISVSATIIGAYFVFALMRKYVPFIRKFLDREQL